ncbi:MAG: O-methyltransferase [Candidatus Hodarchaeales archaeon]
MRISERDMLHLIEKYVDEESVKGIVSGAGPGCGRILSLIMYCLIIHKKPRHVLEFSPAAGGSTIGLGLAMKKLGKPNCLTTIEIQDREDWHKRFDKNMKDNGIEDYVEKITGDALVEIPRIIKERNLKIDFCFIDSDHSATFAKRYIEEIFPLLALPGCIICIHDIAAKSKDPYGPFATNMIPKPENDEWKSIWKWVQKENIDYTLLHALIGGQDTRSINIPWNKRIIQKINTKINNNILKCETRGAPVAIVI